RFRRCSRSCRVSVSRSVPRAPVPFSLGEVVSMRISRRIVNCEHWASERALSKSFAPPASFDFARWSTAVDNLQPASRRLLRRHVARHSNVETGAPRISTLECRATRVGVEPAKRWLHTEPKRKKSATISDRAAEAEERDVTFGFYVGDFPARQRLLK